MKSLAIKMTKKNHFQRLAMKLEGHTAELSNCLWNFDQTLIATSSIDSTARLWDLRQTNVCHVIDDHNDEVLDICFNYTGKLLATVSNDCTCKIWDVTNNFLLMSTMVGHTEEVSKVLFRSISCFLFKFY